MNDYYLKNKDRIRAKQREYYKLNREVHLARNNKYYAKNRETVLEKQKPYRVKNRLKIGEVVRKWAVDNPIQSWANMTLSFHRRKGYVVSINSRDLLDSNLDFSICNICGVALNWNAGKKNTIQDNSPSLDRTHNERTIDLSNIQIVCNLCNTTKNKRTMKEFIVYCKLIAGRF